MRKITVLILALLMLFSFSSSAWAAKTITTPATGYTCGEDVEYVIVSGTVVNWGARGEDCTFLTTYAESYYTETYSWEAFSEMEGGTGTSDAAGSELYKALQAMMKARHTKIQSYQDTRQYYQYTDCVGSDYSLISSFYSGKTVAGKWTGSTYNREHIWPKSKCINTDKKNDSADIMMLRATVSSENSSRGNKAYGESSGYYDPGEDVRGDCARMVLYGYVRWGNTGKMWGTSGVMESLEVLLRWMEEDPVDTWEMGRNDAVQSITGVRNVFVDYPEYAWLLFGAEIPADMVTPSGNGAQEEVHTHSYTPAVTTAATCIQDGILTYICGCGDSYTQTIPTTGHLYEAAVTAPTCTQAGFTTYLCTVCGDSYTDGYTDALGHSFSEWITTPGGSDEESRQCSVCSFEETREKPECQHPNTYTLNNFPPTCTREGSTGIVYCSDCERLVTPGEAIPATGHSDEDRNWLCDNCGEGLCEHSETEVRDAQEALCLTAGYTGDTYCAVCGILLRTGSVTEPTGEHSFGEWSTGSSPQRSCEICGLTEIQYTTPCAHKNIETKNQKDATCVSKGHTGDIYCADCGQLVAGGSVIPATGEHVYGELIGTGSSTTIVRSCTVCGCQEIYYVTYPDPTLPETQPEPQPEPQTDWRPVAIAAVVVLVLAGSVTAVVISKKKKQ